MTQGAIAAKLTGMLIFLPVTGEAIRWSTLVDTIQVTGRTGYRRMVPGQWKSGGGMIERGRQPTLGAVAFSAFSSELPVVPVVQCVACEAIQGSILEDTIDMAACAGDRGMFPDKRKKREAVIEIHL
jgi:hypothetical protein